MNRLVNSFELPVIGEPLGFFVNDEFVVFRYWASSLAQGNYLEHASRFNSTTVYVHHSSGLPAPVHVPWKSGVNLKNDHDDLIRNISLSAGELNKEVLTLKELSKGEIVQLEFVQKGRYCLRYELLKSGVEKQANVDIVVG
jgi:hypothetical protein